jgi:hypothetical protein
MFDWKYITQPFFKFHEIHEPEVQNKIIHNKHKTDEISWMWKIFTDKNTNI